MLALSGSVPQFLMLCAALGKPSSAGHGRWIALCADADCRQQHASHEGQLLAARCITGGCWHWVHQTLDHQWGHEELVTLTDYFIVRCRAAGWSCLLWLRSSSDYYAVRWRYVCLICCESSCLMLLEKISNTLSFCYGLANKAEMP